MRLYKIVGHSILEPRENKIRLIQKMRNILNIGLREAKECIDNLTEFGFARIHLNPDQFTDLQHEGFLIENVSDNIQQTEIVTFFTMHEKLGKYIQHLVSMNAPEVLQAMVITFNTLQKKINNNN